MKRTVCWGQVVATFLFSAIIIFCSTMVCKSSAYAMPQMPDALANVCIEKDNCEGATKWVQVQLKLAESSCQETNDLSEKKQYIEDLLYLQKIVDLLALHSLKVLVTSEALCGGLLNPEITGINVEPLSVELEVDETIELNATIYCFNGTCSGALQWVSDDQTVAKVDHQGVVSAQAPGQAWVTVFSSDFPDFSKSVHVNVTEDGLEVAFIYETLWTQNWFYPEVGINGMGDEILANIERYYTDYKVGVMTYAHHSTYVDPSNSVCGWWSVPGFGDGIYAPYEAATVVLPFQDSSQSDTYVAVQEAHESLRPSCDVPPYWARYNAVSSLYTALMTAVDGTQLGGWSDRDEVTRAIVVIGHNHVCETTTYPNWGPRGLCDTEAISGLNRFDVIDAANEKGIRIFLWHGDSEANYRTIYSEPFWNEIASLTGGSTGTVPWDLDYSWSDVPFAFANIIDLIAEE